MRTRMHKLCIPLVMTVVCLGTACPSGGTNGSRTAKDDQAGLTAEQKANLKRYRQLIVRIAEARQKAKHDEALKLVDRATMLVGQIHQSDHPLAAQTMALRGDIYIAKGSFTLAAKAFENELLLWKKALNPGENIVFAECHHKIGRSYFLAGDLRRASQSLGRAATAKRNTLQKADRRLGKHYVHKSAKPRGVGLAITLGILGLVQWKLKKYDDAARSLKEAVALRRKHLKPTHLSLLRSLLTLAQLSEIRKQYAEAEKLYLELVGRLKKQASPNVALMGQALKNLADVNRRMGKLAKAEKHYKQARAEVVKATRYAKRDVYLALIDSGLGIVYAKTKRYKEAEALLRRAAATFGKQPRKYVVGLVMCNIQLGKMHRMAKRYSKATKAIRAALDAARKHMGLGTYGYARATAELSAVYQAQGAKAQAARLLGRAFAVVHKLYGSSHPRTLRVRGRLEKLYKSLRWNKKLKALPK